MDVALLSANGKHLNMSGDLTQIREGCAEIPEKLPFYYTGVKKKYFLILSQRKGMYPVGNEGLFHDNL